MILEAEGIVKTFSFPKKVNVLSHISLKVKRGQSIAISGRSGEGKTTLLHILGTLEPFDSGTLSIAGETLLQSNPAHLRNRHIGFIFQAFNLLEDFTALENVLMPSWIARKKMNETQGLELLDSVGLIDRAYFPAKLLSGGEKQRVAIARALCNHPDLILADEPSGNLDRANADLIGSLLFRLVEERKMSLILATHDKDLASRCDQQYLLQESRLIPLA